MTNILISLGGNCSTDKDLKKEQFNEIIGVDNGTQHLFNRSITPHVVLGDLDSIDPSLLKKIKTMEIDIKSYEPNKDKTDFELAIESINKPDDKKIYLIGGEEGEIDHLFSIFTIVSNYKFAKNLTWFYQDKKIIFKQNISINMRKGSKFSIIPITNLKDLKITGAEWELNEEDIVAGSSKTLRNISKSDVLKINCESGLFCVVY